MPTFAPSEVEQLKYYDYEEDLYLPHDGHHGLDSYNRIHQL